MYFIHLLKNRIHRRQKFKSHSEGGISYWGIGIGKLGGRILRRRNLGVGWVGYSFPDFYKLKRIENWSWHSFWLFTPSLTLNYFVSAFCACSFYKLKYMYIEKWNRNHYFVSAFCACSFYNLKYIEKWSWNLFDLPLLFSICCCRFEHVVYVKTLLSMIIYNFVGFFVNELSINYHI